MHFTDTVVIGQIHIVSVFLQSWIWESHYLLIFTSVYHLLDAAVLRVPILYGEVERLEESAVTVMFDKIQFSNKSANMDHWQQRFPTYVKDVASICRQLAEKRMEVRTCVN